MDTKELLEIVHTNSDDPFCNFYFKLFENIRAALDENSRGSLGAFPFFELDHGQQRIKSYLGYTFFEGSGEGKKCTKIGMRLRSDQGTFLEPIRLIPTLIHEFAHVVRETTRNVNNGEETEKDNIRSRKLKKLEHGHCSHDDGFYECFAKLLQIAESIKIYKLPAMSNKFSCYSLRRFDKYDLATCMISQCGTSEQYKNLKFVNNNNNNNNNENSQNKNINVNTILTNVDNDNNGNNSQINNDHNFDNSTKTNINDSNNNSNDNNIVQGNTTKIQFVVQSKTGTQKLIILEKEKANLEELIKQSMKKLNLKKRPTRIETKSGGNLINTDELIFNFSGATLLVF